MSDGTEIDSGLNPLKADTDEDGVIDGQEEVYQQVRLDTLYQYSIDEVGTLPIIEMTGQGDYSQKLYAVPIDNNVIISEIDALVGNPFEFVHDDNMSFVSSQLSFEISNELLSRYELEDLRIASYNYEDSELELLETTCDKDNNIISAEVEHYSTYMVVSVSEYFASINYQNESQIISLAEVDTLVDSNDTCRIMLSNYSVVVLEKDPTLGDDTVDTDEDGIPDSMELKEKKMVSLENPSSGTKIEVEAWTFYSNPTKADTDGDGLTDVEDLQPKKFATVVVEENDTYIKFNTEKVWYNISCTAYDYLDNWCWRIMGSLADNEISDEELVSISNNVSKNYKQNFTVEELSYIGIVNNEGAKLYLDNRTQAIRERIFQNITGRESRYYRHIGALEEERWEVVSKETKSGFFEGTVLSEADINLSTSLFYVNDISIVVNRLAQIGAVVITVIVGAEMTPVVLANLQGLSYYVKTFGVLHGFEMYRYLGIEGLPNGVISWLQMDMADGDSSLDDLALCGAKYNADDVVWVTRNSDGKLMWLENGNSKAGLNHIMEGHAADFSKKGIGNVSAFLKKLYLQHQ